MQGVGQVSRADEDFVVLTGAFKLTLGYQCLSQLEK